MVTVTLEKKLLRLIAQLTQKVLNSSLLLKATERLPACVLVENSDVKKRIIPRIASVKRREIKEIHEFVFSRDEFLEMLKSEDENAGKEIARKHFVFYGMVNFYKLILKEKWKV